MSKIYERRKWLGLSQAAVARLAGIGQTTLSEYERGVTEIGGGNLIALANALECSADYLLGLTDDPTPQQPPHELTAQEWAVVLALRTGNRYGAIRLIVLGDD